MGWSNSGDVKTIFLQGVIPLVLGIGLCFLGALYCLGILKFRCKKRDDQVAPVILPVGGNGTNGDARTNTPGGPMTLTAAEKAYGPVACEAQLFGMESKERQSVLESVFTSFCSTHKESDKQLIPAAEDKNRSGGNGSDEESQVDASSGELGNNGLDTRCSCAICLREYEDDDEVMTGTLCNHMFHKNCAMIWLTHYKKPKDHCPYCRVAMLTAAEMRKAAVDVLGEDRVSELSQLPQPDNNSEEAEELPAPVPVDIESGV